ncbi:hypothetical protein WT60_13925 [Burkholderia sp. MSMB617WGS]|nr:hypothetical protein WT60_13925 [Burkholderia sp. MSMB617WGS]
MRTTDAYVIHLTAFQITALFLIARRFQQRRPAIFALHVRNDRQEVIRYVERCPSFFAGRSLRLVKVVMLKHRFPSLSQQCCGRRLQLLLDEFAQKRKRIGKKFSDYPGCVLRVKMLDVVTLLLQSLDDFPIGRYPKRFESLLDVRDVNRGVAELHRLPFKTSHPVRLRKNFTSFENQLVTVRWTSRLGRNAVLEQKQYSGKQIAQC